MKLVLLVEDESSYAEVIRLLLEGEGYRVATASNGEEALKCLQTEKPALILSDFMMPVMHGGELGAAVRRDSALINIPFVFISSSSEHVVRQSFDDYDAFLPKQWDIESLLRLVSRMVDQGRPSGTKSDEVRKTMLRLLEGMELHPRFAYLGAP